MAGPGFAAVGLGECFIDYKPAILVQDTQSAFHPHAGNVIKTYEDAR